HNRATHFFNPPGPMVNQALADGRLDPTLPFIKEVAMNALDAGPGLAETVRKVYRDKHPNVAPDRVEKAIPVLQEIYDRNYFPEMQADWRTFPSHLDHTRSTGCFRCHDDEHKSDDGKVLTKDCNLCHTIVWQKVGDKAATSLEGLEFAHPGE